MGNPTKTSGDPAEALTLLFRALADGTRRRLLVQLTLGPAKVTDLARPFRTSLPAVSKHLRVLEAAGLVSRSVDGRVHRLSLTGMRLREVEIWLDPFRSYWEGTLSALRTDLRQHPPRSRGKGRTSGSLPSSMRRRRTVR